MRLVSTARHMQKYTAAIPERHYLLPRLLFNIRCKSWDQDNSKRIETEQKPVTSCNAQERTAATEQQEFDQLVLHWSAARMVVLDVKNMYMYVYR